MGAGRLSEPTPPNDEQLLQQLEEELKKLKVTDLLVQTLYTVSSLGYRKLSEQERDLDEARLAIEALRALLPVLEGSVDEALVRDFRQVTSNLQLAYADAAKEKEDGDWRSASSHVIKPCPRRGHSALILWGVGTLIVGSFFNDHAVLFALVCSAIAVAYGIGLTSGCSSSRRATSACRRSRAPSRKVPLRISSAST